ncbi:MAG: AfsR/SARP family transcriptional regulator, partial [Acidimicrobiales bacterium]
HALRTGLGPNVVVGRGVEELGLVANHLWCDAVALEAAVGRNQFGEAVELYQGGFLQGFFIKEAPEFERWCEQERARLRSLAYNAALILAQIELRDRRPREAIRWARWCYDLTPDDESALGDLMRVLCMMGNRAAALRAYDEFVERLGRDRGVRPSAVTRRLKDLLMISPEFVMDVAPE